MKQFKIIIYSNWASVNRIVKNIFAPNKDLAENYALQGYPAHWHILSVREL